MSSRNEPKPLELGGWVGSNLSSFAGNGLVSALIKMTLSDSLELRADLDKRLLLVCIILMLPPRAVLDV